MIQTNSPLTDLYKTLTDPLEEALRRNEVVIETLINLTETLQKAMKAQQQTIQNAVTILSIFREEPSDYHGLDMLETRLIEQAEAAKDLVIHVDNLLAPLMSIWKGQRHE